MQYFTILYIFVLSRGSTELYFNMKSQSQISYQHHAAFASEVSTTKLAVLKEEMVKNQEGISTSKTMICYE